MDRYARLPSALRAVVRRNLADSDLVTASVRRKLEHTVLGRTPSLESSYLDNFYSAFSSEEQAQLLAGQHGNPYGSFQKIWRASGAREGLSRLLYADQKTYLVELLMKQDQMSMASSIESRVPFLDHPFVEFSASVPDDMKIRGGVGKYILKQAVKDLLPREILSRKKMGFPTPLNLWLRGPHAGRVFDILRAPDGLLALYLQRDALDRLLDRHANGKIDATDRIWRLLNLQLWGQIFLTGRTDSAPFIHDEDSVGQI